MFISIASSKILDFFAFINNLPINTLYLLFMMSSFNQYVGHQTLAELLHFKQQLRRSLKVN